MIRPKLSRVTILLNIIIINQFFLSGLEYQRMGKRRLFPPDKKQLNSCTSPWVLLYHGGDQDNDDDDDGNDDDDGGENEDNDGEFLLETFDIVQLIRKRNFSPNNSVE